MNHPFYFELFLSNPLTVLVFLAVPMIIYALDGGSCWRRWVLYLGLGWSSLSLFGYAGMTFGVSTELAFGVAGLSTFTILKAFICYSKHQTFLCQHAQAREIEKDVPAES
ncbi:hypothetical protein [Gynuella sp.]|uniref:hypothetical protein n=1 Tax=Gynuella sp. TaxID=2969146 RepID=UPI003D1305EC